MSKTSNRGWLIKSLAAAAVLGTAGALAQNQSLLFISTQFTPIEEAQRMRQVILKDFAGVEYLPQDNAPFTDRVLAEARAGRGNIGLLGGLHGDFPPLTSAGALDNLDDVMTRLANRKFPRNLVTLGKLGTPNQVYVPWMQATYIMVANKQALPYLPPGANVNTLTYKQLAAWGERIQQATGQRRLGFPGGPRGLLHRFTQGYLLPSYASTVVTRFRSQPAVTAWQDFKAIWAQSNPQSTTYDFMQEPLLSGEVWVAWDHVARLRDALTQRPDDFVAFPAPSGPRGLGYMPVVAGLAIPKNSPNRARAVELIEYLTGPAAQAATLRENGFFPVSGAALPAGLAPGLKLMADAVARQSSARTAIASLLPVGLGTRGGEFNKVYQDTFGRIILRNQDIRQVLDQEAVNLRRVMTESKAPCWSPDPASSGPCPVN